MRYTEVDMKPWRDLLENNQDAFIWLNDREKGILILRFGLFGVGIHTLKQIAAIYKRSKERMRVLEKCSLEKLERDPIFKHGIDRLYQEYERDRMEEARK